MCLEDRTLLGAVMEPIGRVQEPMYTIGFETVEELQGHKLEKGTRIFYVNDHSTFVFTQPLREIKGTDASNVHDEEISQGEVEFSDDEKEAEYKRSLKQAKKEKKEKGNEKDNETEKDKKDGGEKGGIDPSKYEFNGIPPTAPKGPKKLPAPSPPHHPRHRHRRRTLSCRNSLPD